MKTLPPCDHDECPPTQCTRTASDKAVVCKELLGGGCIVASIEAMKTAYQKRRETEAHPLRKIVGVEWVENQTVGIKFPKHKLECGHLENPPHDRMGNAELETRSRRRCVACPPNAAPSHAENNL